MPYDAIDSLFVAVPDLDACQLYERLGLRLSPARDGRRTLHVGGPANLFAVHVLAAAGPDGPLARPLRRALAAGRSLFAVALRVADLGATLGRLETEGLRATRSCDGGRAATRDGGCHGAVCPYRVLLDEGAARGTPPPPSRAGRGGRVGRPVSPRVGFHGDSRPSL
jgi:hypothetical protein